MAKKSTKSPNRPTSNRIPVLVDSETYVRLQTYCEQTGITHAHTVNEALNDWLSAVGAARLEAFKKPKLATLLHFVK
jgi:predicted DNA-binding protein